MPKVRASSGMIGTINLPISGSRSSLASMRTKTMVVETSRPAPEPVISESVPDLPLTGEDALSVVEEAPRPARKRGTRGRKNAAPAGDEGDKPASKRARKSRSKTASE